MRWLAALIIIVAVAALIIIRPREATAPTATHKAPSGLPQKTPGRPQFSFMAGKAPGWRQGATDKVSMALFHQYDCFTSVEHKSGRVSIAAELKQIRTGLTASGYLVTPNKRQTLTLQTNAGGKQYELYQSAVMTPAGLSKVKGGQEFGYVQLANSYIKVMGYCDTASQLPSTIPALQAIRLNTAD